MTGPLVVDASVLIALVRHEPARAELVALLRPVPGRGRCLVPEVMWIELTNVLVRRHRLTPAQVVEAVRDVDDLGLDSVPLDRATLLMAIDVAGRSGLSLYDALYLALAEVEDAQLVTLDRELAAAAGPRAVPLPSLGPRRLSESPAPYGSEPIEWARFGPYLARLRAEARGSTGA